MPVSELLTKDGLERFGAVAAGHVGDEKVPGLVALVAHREQVHVETTGSLSVGGRPVRRDSLFRISSTTKPITGAGRSPSSRKGCSAWTSRSTGGCPSWPTAGCCAGWTGRCTRRSRLDARSRCATC